MMKSKTWVKLRLGWGGDGEEMGCMNEKERMTESTDLNHRVKADWLKDDWGRRWLDKIGVMTLLKLTNVFPACLILFFFLNNCNDNNHPNMVLPNFYGQFLTSQREQDRWWARDGFNMHTASAPLQKSLCAFILVNIWLIYWQNGGFLSFPAWSFFLTSVITNWW